MKTCSKCGQEKPETEFYAGKTVCKECRREQSRAYRAANIERYRTYDRKRNRNPERRASQKRTMQKYREKYKAKSRERYAANPGAWRESHLRRRFGMSVEEYDSLCSRQGNRCAICGSEEDGNCKKRLTVDHDHVTGKVRGLLCDRCNRAIGLLRDDPTVLRKAMIYLKGRL